MAEGTGPALGPASTVLPPGPARPGVGSAAPSGLAAPSHAPAARGEPHGEPRDHGVGCSKSLVVPSRGRGKTRGWRERGVRGAKRAASDRRHRGRQAGPAPTRPEGRRVSERRVSHSCVAPTTTRAGTAHIKRPSWPRAVPRYRVTPPTPGPGSGRRPVARTGARVALGPGAT